MEGFRRVFVHTAPIFFERGIARPETGEISSLSCEEAPGHSIVVSVFEVTHTPETIEVGCASGFPHQQDTSRSTAERSCGLCPLVHVFSSRFAQAVLDREHEFRFLAVQTHPLTAAADAAPPEPLAVSMFLPSCRCCKP